MSDLDPQDGSSQPFRPVVLMGLRCSGKSTLSAAAARLLGTISIDLDDRTARALGFETPGEAARTHGWDAFRQAEARTLQDTLTSLKPGEILALGGGTPTAPGAAQTLRSSGAAVVYLHAPAGILGSRLKKSAPDRPSLTGGDPAAELERVYKERDPLYREIATQVVEIVGRSKGSLAAEIASIARGTEA